MKHTGNVTVSFNAIVYNNMPWVKESLLSIIRTCKILKNVHGINCEIIVLDNYSDDGSYEEILKMKYKIKDIPIRVARYRGKRGLCRHLDLLLSNGSYVIYVDMDTIYNSRLLAELIARYLSNPLLLTKSLYITLVPRMLALKVGGFQDLNRTEDVEYCAKLAKERISLPLIDPATFRLLLSEPLEKFHEKNHLYKNPSARMFIQTYSSERRYAKTFRGYIKREFNNKIDMICGLGLTPRKIVRELWFLKKIRGLNFLIGIFYHLTFWFITVLLKRKIYTHSRYLSNSVLCDYGMIINYIELLKKAIKLGLIMSNKAIKYFREIRERALTALAYAKSFES